MARQKTKKQETETKTEPKRVESSPNRIALMKCKALVDFLNTLQTPIDAIGYHSLLHEANTALQKTTYKNLTDKASRIESLKTELKSLLGKEQENFTDENFNRAQAILAEINKLEKKVAK